MNIFILVFNIFSFIPNAYKIIIKEQTIYNTMINNHNLYCHLQSTRIKLFPDTIKKINKLKLNDIYDLHDLIAFRYVFYEKEDLLKFYYLISNEKKVINRKNYILNPKENGYSSIHIKYINEYSECPIKYMECQLYIIDDYYNSIYGNATYDKYKNIIYPIKF